MISLLSLWMSALTKVHSIDWLFELIKQYQEMIDVSCFIFICDEFLY